MSRPLVRTTTPGIYRRGERYVVIVRDRERRQLKRFAPTLDQARKLKAQLTVDVTNGRLQGGPAVGFSDYAEKWMTTYRGRTSRGLRPSTMEGYQRSLRQYAIPFFKNTPLRQLHLRDIKAFAEMIAKTGATQNTIRGYVGVVKLVLATAVEDGVISFDPAAGFRNVYGAPTTQRRKALTDHELELVIEELPARYRIIARFLAATGLRIGELAALEWNDIDWLANRIHVERRFYNGTVDTQKTANGIRSIPLAGDIVAELRRHQLATSGRGSDLVFPTQAGTFIDSRTLLGRVFKPAFRRAGVPWASLHSLRHTCASRLFRSGWNAKQVQMILGHHSPAFTMSTYIHLMPEDLPPLPPTPGSDEGGSSAGSVIDLGYARMVAATRRAGRTQA